jgi:hypothetical protein
VTRHLARVADIAYRRRGRVVVPVIDCTASEVHRFAVCARAGCGYPAGLKVRGSVGNGRVFAEQAHGEARVATQLATRAGVDERCPV